MDTRTEPALRLGSSGRGSGTRDRSGAGLGLAGAGQWHSSRLGRGRAVARLSRTSRLKESPSAPEISVVPSAEAGVRFGFEPKKGLDTF